MHRGLEELITQRTPFRLLNNETVQIAIDGHHLNLCGLGDLWSGHFQPSQAFQNYDKEAPGIICCHNPDSIDHLDGYPGEIVLCGHTHGGQVNLPLLRNRFLGISNPHLYRGHHQVHGRHLYINRGVGAVFKFRWFASPELLELTLRREPDE